MSYSSMFEAQRERAEAAEREVARLTAENDRLLREVIRVNDRFAKTRDANIALKTENDQLQRQYDSVVTNRNELLARVDTLDEIIEQVRAVCDEIDVRVPSSYLKRRVLKVIDGIRS